MNHKKYTEPMKITKYTGRICLLVALLALNYWYLNRYLSSNASYMTDFTPQEDVLSEYRQPLVAGLFYAIATAPSKTESDEKNAVSPNPDVDDRSGGPGLGGKLVVAAVILLAAGAAVIIFRKKGGKKGMMILFCITAAGTFSTMQKVEALESETRIISVSETVTVSGKQCDLTANVRFTMDIPDMQAAVEEYYEDNSEEIISVEDVKETEDVFTEKEAITFLSERGFNEYPLTYDFNMDGTYVDEAEASLESNEKHPMYQTFYVSEDGSIWTVFIVGKTIAANPASYNLESDIDAQILVSEAETLTSYTEMGNKLYKTIPKESAVILKVVDKITSEKLNSLTYEEVVKQ